MMMRLTTSDGFLMIVIIIIINFIFIIFTPSSTSDILVVDDDIGPWVDYPTINDAVVNASDYDIIRVFEGEYTEEITTNRSLQIKGNGTSKTIVNGVANHRILTAYWAQSIVLENITIKHGGAGYWERPSILIENSTNVIIKNSQIMNGNYTGLIVINSTDLNLDSTNINNNNEHGAVFLYCSSINISNSHFTNNSEIGVEIHASDNITVKSSVFKKNIEQGLVGGDVIDVELVSNLFTSHTLRGLLVRGSHIIIYNCTSTFNERGLTVSGDNISILNTNLSKNTRTGLFIHGGDILIQNNNISDNGGYGIDIWESYNVTILNNLINNNSEPIQYDSAIRIWYSNDVDVQNNNINGTDGYGIRLWVETSNITITNNHIIDSNKSGIFMASFIGSPSTHILVCNNTIQTSLRYGIEIDYYDNRSYFFNTYIHHNFFINNSYQAIDNGSEVFWNDSSVGNYWSDHNNTDTNHDGIADNPYHVPGNSNSIDHYPLAEPFGHRRFWTWIVDDDAGVWADFHNITDALNNVPEGDAIRVYAGDYNESFVINKTIQLIGNGTSDTFVSSYLSECAVAVMSHENVSIEGFNFYGNGSGIAILSTNVVNARISNCRFTDYDIGIRARSSYNISVSNCDLIDVNRNGIELLNAPYALIDDVSFVNCSLYVDGDQIEHFDSHEIRNSTVNGYPVEYLINESISDIRAGQLIAVDCSMTSIRNVSVSRGSVGALVAYSSEITIDNVIVSQCNIGMLTKNLNGSRITNAIISDSAEIGLLLNGSNNNIVVHNTVENSLTVGVQIDPFSDENSCNNNIFDENTVQVIDESGNNKWDDGSEGNYWSDYNGTDLNLDGIGDTAYQVHDSPVSIDRYPLMEPGGGRGGRWTWIVDDDDGRWRDFSSVQDAIDYVPSGDVIRVYSGTYHETPTVTHSVEIIGNGTSETFVVGDGEGDVITVTGQNTSIEGLHLTLSGAENAGIVIRNANCTVSSVKVVECGVGILVNRTADDCIIRDSVLRQNAQCGIKVLDSLGCTITNNTCDSNWYGIQCVRSSVTLFNNSCNYNVKYGVHIENVTSPSITNQICANGSYGISLVDVENGWIGSSKLSGNTYGIHLERVSDSSLSEVIVDSNEWGVVLGNSSDNEISQVYVNETINVGILCLNSSDNLVSDCQFRNNDDHAISMDNDSSNNSVHHNIFTSNTGSSSQAFDSGDDNLWDDGSKGNWWSDYQGLDLDGDGIGEVPYPIAGPSNATDRYPITEIIGIAGISIFLDVLSPVEKQLVTIFVEVTQNFQWNDSKISFFIDGERIDEQSAEIKEGTTLFIYNWTATEGTHNLTFRLQGLSLLEHTKTVEVADKAKKSSSTDIPVVGLFICAIVLIVVQQHVKRNTWP